MDKDDIKRLIEELGSDSTGLGQELLELLEEEHGTVPISERILERRPDILAGHTIKVLARGGFLDPKVNELIALAAAAALRNDAALKAHMEMAFSYGATSNEVLESLIIAGLVVESATNEVSFRVFRQVEGWKDTNERWGKSGPTGLS